MSGRVLFLSHTNPDAFNDVGNGYIREFVKNGAYFLDYEEIYFERGHRGSQDFLKNFIRENGIRAVIYAADATSFHLPPEFFRGLRPEVFTATMVGDSVYYYDVRDKYYGGAVDLFVIYDSFDNLEAFKAAGGDAVFFWLNYDRTKYLRSASPDKPIDVSFIGGMAGRPERAEFLNYLKANGIDVRVYGGGTPGGKVSLEQMVEIFNKSKINLNFTDASVPTRLTRNLEIPPGRKQMKGRLSELAICGAFILSEYAKDIDRILAPDKEIALFVTREELLEKVRHYLKHGEERAVIAEGAYRRALRDYDVSVSIPRLLDIIDEKMRAPRRNWAGIPPDPVFLRNFASFRVLCTIRFIKRLKFLFALEELAIILRLRTLDLSQIYDFLMEEVADKFPRTKSFLKKLMLK